MWIIPTKKIGFFFTKALSGSTDPNASETAREFVRQFVECTETLSPLVTLADAIDRVTHVRGAGGGEEEGRGIYSYSTILK